MSHISLPSYTIVRPYHMILSLYESCHTYHYRSPLHHYMSHVTHRSYHYMSHVTEPFASLYESCHRALCITIWVMSQSPLHHYHYRSPYRYRSPLQSSFVNAQECIRICFINVSSTYKLWVSFAEYSLFYRALLQKWRIIFIRLFAYVYILYMYQVHTHIWIYMHIFIYMYVYIYIYMYIYKVLSNHTNKADRNVRTGILVKFRVDHHANLFA